MTLKKLFLSFIPILLFFITSCQTFKASMVNTQEHMNKPYVVLVSIDGYRYDYNKKYSPPNLSTFFKDSAWAKGLIPVFPSKTFPNHYSMVTGLKAANHGIVANGFWDPKRKEMYQLGKPNTLDGTWYGGEPIWVAAGKQGMVSASYYWVGSDANIQGRYPTYYYRYNGKVPNEERVNQVIDWLKLPPKKRPHFITLYFSDVDSAGHRHSPDSKQVRQAIMNVDRSLKLLFDGIKKIGLPVNIIVVSDHGMQTYTKDKYLYLADYISLDGIRVVGKGPHALIYTNDPKKKETIYKKLKKIKPIKVHKPEKMPNHYGYSNNPRVGNLVLSVKPGYYLYHIRPLDGFIPKITGPKGTHGYDAKDTSNMNGIFFAKGPNIKTIGEMAPFQNIHIYPLIMDILGLKIQTKIDGKRAMLSRRLLR